EVDVAVPAGEAGGEPFLLLSAILAVPGDADQMGRQVIAQPVGLMQPLSPVCADLFLELAQRRRPRILVPVDAALRHLPGAGRVDPLGGEDPALAVEQSDSHPPAVRQGGGIDWFAHTLVLS